MLTGIKIINCLYECIKKDILRMPPTVDAFPRMVTRRRTVGFGLSEATTKTNYEL
jgi:hypothetical protein